MSDDLDHLKDQLRSAEDSLAKARLVLDHAEARSIDAAALAVLLHQADAISDYVVRVVERVGPKKPKETITSQAAVQQTREPPTPLPSSNESDPELVRPEPTPYQRLESSIEEPSCLQRCFAKWSRRCASLLLMWAAGSVVCLAVEALIAGLNVGTKWDNWGGVFSAIGMPLLLVGTIALLCCCAQKIESWNLDFIGVLLPLPVLYCALLSGLIGGLVVTSTWEAKSLADSSSKDWGSGAVVLAVWPLSGLIFAACAKGRLSTPSSSSISEVREELPAGRPGFQTRFQQSNWAEFHHRDTQTLEQL